MVGERYTTKNRLAQMLMQQENAAAPIQSHTQGLASALRQGLAGYMMGSSERELAERQAADEAARAAVAQAYSSGMQSYNPSQRQVMTPPDGLGGPSPSRPVSPYSGIIQNLSALPDSDYKSKAMQDVGMMNMNWMQQQEADRLAKSDAARMLADERAYNEQQYKRQLAGQKELAQFEAGLAAPKDNRTPAQKDYEYARSQGYTGTMQDFLISKAAAQGGNIYTPASQTGTGAGQMTPIPGSPAAIQAEKLNIEKSEKTKMSEATEASAMDTINQLNQLATHPAMSSMVGAPSSFSGATYKMFDTPIAGTPEADFKARLDQLGGKQFLQAFEGLKGGGQITEIEGKKATDAIARLQNTGLSEEDYKQAIADFQDVIMTGLNRERASRGLSPLDIDRPWFGQSGNSSGWSIQKVQ